MEATMEEKPTAMAYKHIAAIYEEMYRQSLVEDIDGKSVRVYEGFLTKLVQGLQLAAPYYTLLRKYLIPMGCVHQLQRGGATTPSRWLLITEPSEVDFNNFETLNRPQGGKLARQEQATRDLAVRMSALEDQVEQMWELVNAQREQIKELQDNNPWVRQA